MRRPIAVLVVAAAAAAGSLSASATTTHPAGAPNSIAVNGTPLAIASGYGSLWVAGHDATVLYRIDPATGRIRARIGEGTNACGPLGVAFNRIWIGHCDTGNTDAVVDARTNRVVGRVNGLAFGFGFASAWVDAQQQNPTVLNRIDPRTFRVLDRIQVGSGTRDAVSAGGFMWNVNSDEGTLSQISPSSNRVVRTIRYGGSGSSYGIVAAGKIWILDVADNAVYTVAPHTQAVRKLPIRLSFSSDFDDPYMVVAGGRVWFLSANEGFDVKGLVAVDASSGRIVRRVNVPSGFGPYFAVVANSVWGAQPMQDRVLRIPLS